MVLRALKPVGFYTSLGTTLDEDVIYIVQNEAIVVYLGWTDREGSPRHEFLLSNGQRGYQTETWNPSRLIAHRYLDEL